MADVIHKVLQDFPAARRVRDLGMKLQSVKFALPIFHRGKIATFSTPHDAKTFRQCGDFITMAIPNVELVT